MRLVQSQGPGIVDAPLKLHRPLRMALWWIDYSWCRNHALLTPNPGMYGRCRIAYTTWLSRFMTRKYDHWMFCRASRICKEIILTNLRSWAFDVQKQVLIYARNLDHNDQVGPGAYPALEVRSNPVRRTSSDLVGPRRTCSSLVYISTFFATLPSQD